MWPTLKRKTCKHADSLTVTLWPQTLNWTTRLPAIHTTFHIFFSLKLSTSVPSSSFSGDNTLPTFLIKLKQSEGNFYYHIYTPTSITPTHSALVFMEMTCPCLTSEATCPDWLHPFSSTESYCFSHSLLCLLCHLYSLLDYYYLHIMRHLFIPF